MRFLFSFTLFLVGFSSYSQNNYWYFGNGAGLLFSSTKVQRLIDSEMFTDESCASVSDQNGDLLFYTNGVKIWNYKHEVINPIDLKGTKSSSTIAVCQKPSTENEFYIFTTDEKAGANGLTYTHLKIENVNEGKSAGRMKSTAFFTPDLMERKLRYNLVAVNQKIIEQTVSEKVCIAPHQNGRDLWLVTHSWNSNKFISILITKEGFKDRIESSVGSVHKNDYKNNGSEAIGIMKVSHDSKKLASVISYRENHPVELFDFDASTGMITLSKSIPVQGTSYGVEFSPDNSKLYISFLDGPNNLIQVDLVTKRKRR